MKETEHTFYNENDKLQKHPGYAKKICPGCDEEFIVGKNIADAVNGCGSRKCGYDYPGNDPAVLQNLPKNPSNPQEVRT